MIIMCFECWVTVKGILCSQKSETMPIYCIYSIYAHMCNIRKLISYEVKKNTQESKHKMKTAECF